MGMTIEPIPGEEPKTMKENLESGAKYSGTSIALSAAIVGIITFFIPEWKPIDQHMLAILTFVVNLIMVYVTKK